MNGYGLHNGVNHNFFLPKTINYLNNRILLPIALILFVSFSCKRKTINRAPLSIITYKDFHEPTRLSFKEDNLKLSSEIFRLAIVDTVLLAADLSGDENLKIIGLTSKKVLRSLIKRGNNINETINITDFSSTDRDNIIWSYDLTLKKFQRIDVSKALQQTSYVPEEEFTIGKDIRGITSPVWIQRGKLACLSLALDDCRYLYFNEKLHSIEKVGQMPQPDPNWPEQNKNAKMGILGMSYSAILRKHPSENKFAILYENTDRIDIYHNDKLKKTISGPDHFKVIKAFNQQGTGAYIPKNIRTTKYAFFDAYTTSKFIYALYSGTTKTTASEILVFNWAGTPVKRYILNKKLIYFAFKSEENGFSVFGFNSGHLIHTNIKEPSDEKT